MTIVNSANSDSLSLWGNSLASDAAFTFPIPLEMHVPTKEAENLLSREVGIME